MPLPDTGVVGSALPVATSPDAIDLLGVQGAVTKKLASSLLATQGELDAHLHTGMYVDMTTAQTVAGAKTFTSPLEFVIAGRDTNSKIDLDPSNGMRILGDVAANVLTIRNVCTQPAGVSAVIFVDNSAAWSGNGKEHFAIGHDNNGSNGVFSFSNFIETSNDPAAGVTTNTPTPLKIIQTGVLNGTYGNWVRQEFASNGTITFYDYSGVNAMFTIPAVGDLSAPGDLRLGGNLGLGHVLEPDARLDIRGTVGVGIRITDTTPDPDRATNITQESGYFAINAGGGNGIRLSADGADSLFVKSGNVGVGAVGGHIFHVTAPTQNGIRITDSTTARDTYMTHSTDSYFAINAGGGNGLRLTADALDAFQTKAGGIGFFGSAPVAKPTGTPADATDLATVITLANNLKAKIISLGLIA